MIVDLSANSENSEKGASAEFLVGNVIEALTLCHKMLAAGEADIFRGQPHPWPMVPSAHRLGYLSQDANPRLGRFIDWLSVSSHGYLIDGVGALGGKQEFVAIAQHYGIATEFLDFTTSPEVAAFFALDGDAPKESTHAIIYVGRKDNIAQVENCTLVETHIPNLWRMESQKGLFVHLREPSASSMLTNSFKKILFPREPLEVITRTTISRSVIYPPRKSTLELVIDQFLYDELYKESMASQPPTEVVIRRKLKTYPGIFKNRSPVMDRSWLNNDLRWLRGFREKDSLPRDHRKAELHLQSFPTARELAKELTRQLYPLLSEAWQTRAFLDFDIDWTGSQNNQNAVLNTALSAYWDGLRARPYSTQEVIISIITSIALAIGPFVVSKSTDLFEDILGDVTRVKFAYSNARALPGLVNTKSIIEALSHTLAEQIQPYYLRKANDDPLLLLEFVEDPLVLFDFERFKSVFVEELLPSFFAIVMYEHFLDGALTSTTGVPVGSPGPAHVASFAKTGLDSIALSFERDVSRLIYVEADMTHDDLKDQVLAAAQWFFAKEKPMEVKFSGFDRDKRELWQIPEAVSLATYLVELGLLSLLAPQTRRGKPKNSQEEYELATVGLGALDIWVMSTGRGNEYAGQLLGDHPEIMFEFVDKVFSTREELLSLYVAGGGNAEKANAVLTSNVMQKGW